MTGKPVVIPGHKSGSRKCMSCWDPFAIWSPRTVSR